MDDICSFHHTNISISKQYLRDTFDNLGFDECISELKGIITHIIVLSSLPKDCDDNIKSGIADWIRIKCELIPKHWSNTPGTNWDVGYEKTAYFLDWIESNYNIPLTTFLKEYLDSGTWDKSIIEAKLGTKLEVLWEHYKKGQKNIMIPIRSHWPNIKVTFKLSEASKSTFEKLCSESDAVSYLTQLLEETLIQLYKVPDHSPVWIRNLTWFCESMDGVAHTNGDRYDKEIHLSHEYLQKYMSNHTIEQSKNELEGVMRHELVHVIQHNGKRTLPGGLVEGIADYIRIRSGCIAPHWQRKKGGSWTNGYSTTGYFLEWIEDCPPFACNNFVTKLNASLENSGWKDELFENLIGSRIDAAWDRYQNSFE
ncbi:hypothetical protein BC833DRAFT_573743 [Globomyces pollinis-pini]|nr:hypothetical protein BC833DRAFT_573743 [Globomyces pollinis-pini]